MSDEPKELCDHCQVDDAEPMHECPYKVEIHQDGRECNCCKDCTRQCALDI